MHKRFLAIAFKRRRNKEKQEQMKKRFSERKFTASNSTFVLFPSVHVFHVKKEMES